MHSMVGPCKESWEQDTSVQHNHHREEHQSRLEKHCVPARRARRSERKKWQNDETQSRLAYFRTCEHQGGREANIQSTVQTVVNLKKYSLIRNFTLDIFLNSTYKTQF